MRRSAIILGLLSCTPTSYYEEVINGGILIYTPDSSFVEIFDSVGNIVYSGYTLKLKRVVYKSPEDVKNVKIIRGAYEGCKIKELKVDKEKYPCPIMVRASEFSKDTSCNICKRTGEDYGDSLVLLLDFDPVYVIKDSTCLKFKSSESKYAIEVQNLKPGIYKIRVDSSSYYSTSVSSRECRILYAGG